MRSNIAALIAYILISTVESDVDIPSCKVLDAQPLQAPFSGEGLLVTERILQWPSSVSCSEDEIIVDNHNCSFCNKTDTMVCVGSSVTSLPEPQELPDIKFSMRVLGSLINVIKKQAFYGKRIKELLIENNKYIVLNPEAFDGVSDTEYLSLANSNLKQIPIQMFKPLKDLVTLVLDDNNIIIAHNTDSKNSTTFDPVGKYLTKLEYLLLQNNPLTCIPEHTFEWLKDSKLRYMSLRGSKIEFVHQDAFRPLSGILKGLEMADSSYVGDIIANITAGFFNGTHSTLEYLGLSSTGLIGIPKKALETLSNSLVGLALQGNTFHKLDIDSFPEMPALQTIDLRRCSILMLGDDAFKGLKSLKNLFLSGNRFKFLKDSPFRSLSALEFLDLNNNPDPILSGLETEYKIKNKTFSGLKSLKILNLAHSRVKDIENGTFYDTPSLTTLSLCNTFIDLETNFLQAAPNLRVLDLSNNENLKLDPRFFKGLDNLEKLRLINCNIEFQPESNVEFFINLPNLTDLHLSYNKISVIPANTFRPLRKLKSIHLDHNLLDSWTYKIFENNTKLTHVDIDNNQICHFANETAEELLTLSHISFEYNPLLCDCNLYNFVQSLVHSNVVVSHWSETDNSYSCYETENERSLLIAHYIPNCYNAVQEPYENPDSDSTMVAIISGSTVVAICLIVVSACTVIYKKRSNLRYFGIMVKNALSVALMDDNDDNSQEDTIFIYDVFVSYCDSDREWVIKKLLPELEQENHLRVCLHERDFQPGYGILDNIMHCIDKSRSLIIVVSKKSLKSQWCHFEMHLAQHRFIETRKEQLILVLMEELPRSQRPRTLHYLMATRTFLMWDEKQSELFWKRLRRVLILEKSRAVSIV